MMSFPLAALVTPLLLTVSFSSGQLVCAPSCDESTVAGSVIRDPSNCLRYYTCEDAEAEGELQPTGPLDCDSGYYFNDSTSTSSCEPIEGAPEGFCTGHCNPCKLLCGPMNFFPHPTDCSRFYGCVDGVYSEEVCNLAPNIYFNYKTQFCNPVDSVCFTFCDPCEVYCVEKMFLADPVDCTRYYECDPPNKVLFSCPDGENFDEELQVCSAGAECEVSCPAN